MAVVDHTRVGCSPLISAERPWRARRIDPEADDPIEWWIHDEPCRDDFIEPGTKLVLVVDHVNPQYEHQRSDGSWASILDQDFAADIEDSYRQLVSKAWDVDAQVVFATAPRLLSYHEVGIDHDPRRAEAYNSLVLALAAELQSTAAGAAGPGVALIDTAAELGRFGAPRALRPFRRSSSRLRPLRGFRGRSTGSSFSRVVGKRLNSGPAAVAGAGRPVATREAPARHPIGRNSFARLRPQELVCRQNGRGFLFRGCR